MALEFTDFTAALAQQLTAYRNRISGAAVRAGTEVYARAAMGAAAVAQLTQGLSWVRDQIFPDTADTEHLERWTGLYGLARNGPTAATGSITITGIFGTAIPLGQRAIHEDGTIYETTAIATIPGPGTVNVAAEAVTLGTVGNKSAGDAVTLQSPPAGADTDAELATDFSGGSDTETDAALRSRVLARMRSGDGGGTLADYERWALEVDGVFVADALRWRRGPGTVTVAIYEEGAGGNRVPATGVLTAAQAAIEALRPAAAEVDVIAATEVTQDVTVVIDAYIDGYDEAEVRDAVEAAVEDHIYGLATGGTLYRSRLGAAISATPGVLDFTLSVPASNVSPTLDYSNCEVLVPGTVAVS